MQRIVHLIILSTLLIGISVRTAEPSPRSRPLLNFWGMVVRDPYYEWNTNPAWPGEVNRVWMDSMLDNLQQIGVEWVRFEFHADWDGSEYGSFNLAQAEYFVQAAHARDMKVLALIGTDMLKGTQSQVIQFDTDPVLKSEDPIFGYGLNAYTQAWLHRALEITDHYSGSLQIDGYELFNEPNFYAPLWEESKHTRDQMRPFWMAQTITKLYRITHTAPRQMNVPMILGGIHPKQSRERGGLTDLGYIQALYTSDPFSDYHKNNGRWPLDGVAYHPYPVEMQRLVDNDYLPLVGPRLDQAIATMRTYDADAKLWITEIGTRADPSNPAELQRQADFMATFIGIIFPRHADLGPMFWFKYEDFPPASEAWGVVHVPYSCDSYDPLNNCYYEVNGTVQVFKPSYYLYASLAFNYQPRVYLPLIGVEPTPPITPTLR